MDKRFLLTYLSTERRFKYAWFETEKEMKEFILSNNYIDEVIDCIEIKEAREAVEKVEAKKNEAIEKLEEENRKNSIGIYLRFVKQGAISLSEAAKELGIPKSDLELMI